MEDLYWSKPYYYKRQLNDVAIEIDRTLTALEIEYGIFGGYAIVVSGAERRAKDIDCFVDCTKDWLLQKLSPVNGFRAIGTSRPDMVTFSSMIKNSTWVNFFPISMSTLSTRPVQVMGNSFGVQEVVLMQIEFLYKGKLAAAALRSNHIDHDDLLFLEAEFKEELASRVNVFNKCHAGLALRNYPDLEESFARLGLTKDECEASLKTFDTDAIDEGHFETFAAQNAALSHWMRG